MAVLIRLGLLLLLLGAAGALSGLAVAQSDNPLLYELLRRMELLEQELRQLRGDLEVLQHRQRGAADGSLAQRVEALEQRLGAGAPVADGSSDGDSTLAGQLLASPPPPPPPSVAPRALPPPPPGAREVYEQGAGMVRDGRYAEGIAELRRFINIYPTNTLTPDVYFWLGEAHYAQREFDQAEQALITLGANYPGHERIPDALLKLGYIYGERGDTARARQVLEQLLESYPNSVAASLGEMQLRQLR